MSRADAVRAAAVALTYEIEATMRLLDSLPPEPPTESQRAQLKQVLGFRTDQIISAQDVLTQSIDGAIAAILEAAPVTWTWKHGPDGVRNGVEDVRG